MYKDPAQGWVCSACGYTTKVLLLLAKLFLRNVLDGHTERPKIYRKSILNQMQYRFAVNFGTLSIFLIRGIGTGFFMYYLPKGRQVWGTLNGEFTKYLFVDILFPP